MRAPADSIQRLARHKALADLGSPVLDQALAARLLPRLPAWRFQKPAGGAALWIELPGCDARSFAQVALRHGVEVVPGAVMDPTGTHDNYLRLPYTFPADVLTEVAARLAAAWAELV
ncbi:hypothetical protein [Actinomadura sp. 6N118]|uniref:hypothetical protein n=1 Tax=Actinomadura sp. 6N118 TaxID=3375151 RepID=UPI003788D1CD